MKRSTMLIALIAIALAGCSAGEQAESTADAAVPYDQKSAIPPMSGVEGYGTQPGGGADGGESRARLAGHNPTELQKATHARALRRAVIRNAELLVRVDNVEKAEKKVASIVEATGGYISGTNSADLSGELPSLKMSLKVSADQFDTAMAALQGLGDRITKNIQTQDVTAQLVDVDARLAIMRDEESALRNLLRKAGSQSQMLDIQQRIMNLRSEIESLAAQQRELSGLAALSSIELELTQSTATAVANTDPNWAVEALGTATASLASAGRLLGTLAIWLVLFAPIWIPLMILSRYVLRTTRHAVPE